MISLEIQTLYFDSFKESPNEEHSIGPAGIRGAIMDILIAGDFTYIIIFNIKRKEKIENGFANWEDTLYNVSNETKEAISESTLYVFSWTGVVITLKLDKMTPSVYIKNRVELICSYNNKQL